MLKAISLSILNLQQHVLPMRAPITETVMLGLVLDIGVVSIIPPTFRNLLLRIYKIPEKMVNLYWGKDQILILKFVEIII